MARSVIACNPRLPNDCLRIPLMFAQRLQIHETVTPLNKSYLDKFLERAYLNQYPKITEIKKGSRRFRINGVNKLKLDYGDIISRDLVDGDVVYFNRQPTLLYSNITALRILVNPDPSSYVTEFNVTI